MKCSAERLIEALIKVELMAEENARKQSSQDEKPPYVVTVSRSYGSGGKEMAQALADTLGVRCCDRTILQEVSRRANMDVELVKHLDEHVRDVKEEWWHALVDGKVFTQEQYLHHLVKVVLNISRKGGVIVGRGAHLILGPCRAFRVRVVGSLSECTARVMEREGLGEEAAQQRVIRVNQERADYVRELYGADLDDLSSYDLVINSDRFTVAEMVEMVLFGMARAGYTLPETLLP